MEDSTLFVDVVDEKVSDEDRPFLFEPIPVVFRHMAGQVDALYRCKNEKCYHCQQALI